MNISNETRQTILEWMSLKPNYRELIRELGEKSAIKAFIGTKSYTWLGFALRGMKLSIWKHKRRRRSDA